MRRNNTWRNITISGRTIVDLAIEGDLRPKQKSMPRALVSAPDAAETLLLKAAERARRDYGLHPFTEDHGDFYRALELIKRGSPTDRVVALYAPSPIQDSGIDNSLEEFHVDGTRRRVEHVGRHSWRKHEREARRDRRLRAPETLRILPLGYDRLLLRVVDETKSDGKNGYDHAREREVTRIARLQHTNEILEYFGFRDGMERGKLLRSFNGDAHHGADMVRAAYRIASTYGLAGSYDDTTSRVKDIFSSIAFYIHMHGNGFANIIARTVGIDHLPEIKDFSPMRFGWNLYLVPRQDVQTLDARLRTSSKGIKDLPATMASLGYTKTEVRGIPVYRR